MEGLTGPWCVNRFHAIVAGRLRATSVLYKTISGIRTSLQFFVVVIPLYQSIIDEIDTLCLSFIAAFKEYLSDWTSQRQKEDRDPSSIGHDLDIAIRPQIAHLTQEGRWPLPGPLGNIVRQLKKEILKLGTVVRNDCEEENFSSAYRAISDYLLGKMKTSPNGSMVILGCSAVLSNGCVIAPKGSILVALTAKAFNIPVVVVSQTLKFVDKVQSYGRVALLTRESTEPVPPDLVTAIVTDIRVLPPSSAPAVLKAKALDLE
uniref:Translation initiation factor eIF2B subunit delta n=1 Tax=Angiostrongylus cantonensis TaxID=6313 RepID=A0A0K0CTX5_ANGCA